MEKLDMIKKSFDFVRCGSHSCKKKDSCMRYIKEDGVVCWRIQGEGEGQCKMYFKNGKEN